MKEWNIQEDDDVTYSPVKPPRASEIIYEQIKKLITDGDLKPGDRLPSERELMKKLQRSRPIIREALRMLDQSGFILTIPGATGAVVQELSTSTVEQPLESMLQLNKITLEELSEYRSFTDSAIAELAAARRTEENLATLTEILKKAENLTDNYKEFVLYDIEFHEVIAITAKNEIAFIMTRVFSRVVMGLIERKMENLDSEGRRRMCQDILSTHKKILNAIAMGDGKTARTVMHAHIQAFSEDLKINDKTDLNTQDI